MKAVQEGRKKEFEYFFNSGKGEFPDPQSKTTFENSKLNWDFKKDRQQNYIFEYYKELLKLRKQGIFEVFRSNSLETSGDEDLKLLKVSAQDNVSEFRGIYNFGSELYSEEISAENTPEIIISSADKKWGGKLSEKDVYQDNKIIVPAEAIIIYKTQK